MGGFASDFLVPDPSPRHTYSQAASFNRRYQNPIIAGQDRDASDEEVAKGQSRLEELMGLCGGYMLRRYGSWMVLIVQTYDLDGSFPPIPSSLHSHLHQDL